MGTIGVVTTTSDTIYSVVDMSYCSEHTVVSGE